MDSTCGGLSLLSVGFAGAGLMILILVGHRHPVSFKEPREPILVTDKPGRGVAEPQFVAVDQPWTLPGSDRLTIELRTVAAAAILDEHTLHRPREL